MGVVEMENIQNDYSGLRSIAMIIDSLLKVGKIQNMTGAETADMISDFLENYGVDTPDSFVMINNIRPNSAATIQIIERINKLASEYKFAYTPYKLMRGCNDLALDIKTIFPILESQDATLPLNQNKFCKMLRKENWFVDYKPVKLYHNICRRCYIININKLLEQNADIGTLTNKGGDAKCQE
jgi:hypothetical protein